MLFLFRPTALSIFALACIAVWWVVRVNSTNQVHAAVRSDLEGITTSPPRTALEEALDAGPVASQDALSNEIEPPLTVDPEPAAPPIALVPPPNATPAPPTPAPATTPPVSEPAAPVAPARNGFSAGESVVAKPSAPPSDAASTLKSALDLVASNPIEARKQLSVLLLSSDLTPADARLVADALNAITQQIFFTPVFNAQDSTCSQYIIQSGDALSKIVKREKLACDWRLVKRINNLKSESAIREGQRLKLPRGTFHAIVHKRDYRLDLVLDKDGERVIVACFPVGLGSSNGTPLGKFRVRPQSKLVNPEWTHPVSGEHYAADDPRNPIGEHWLGLEGTDATNRELIGYGIHGTVDPGSIGQDMSLGCVRMFDTDVAIVWECLTEPNSTIEIK